MADSKLVNEHRAWLKDAEKGKTRACICAIAFFVFYSAVAIVNLNFELISGFLVFVVMLVSLIGSLLLFNGYNAGRFWVMVPEALIIIYTTYMIMQNIDPDVVENPMTSGQIVLIILLEFLLLRFLNGTMKAGMTKTGMTKTGLKTNLMKKPLRMKYLNSSVNPERRSAYENLQHDGDLRQTGTSDADADTGTEYPGGTQRVGKEYLVCISDGHALWPGYPREDHKKRIGR